MTCSPRKAESGRQFGTLQHAYLAVRGSGQINGVSKLHGKMSREIFQPLFPAAAKEEVPIGVNNAFMCHLGSAEADGYGPCLPARSVGRGDRPVRG